MTNLDDIREYIKSNKKSSLEFDIIWLNNETKQKVMVIIEEVLKKQIEMLYLLEFL